MRILVTGANGFVGTWLTNELLAAGHAVTGFPAPEALDIADRAGYDLLRTLEDKDEQKFLDTVRNSCGEIGAQLRG